MRADVLAGAERVDGDDLVHEVRGADGDGVDLGIVYDVVVVFDGDAALVVLDGFIRAFLDDVAEILDLGVGAVHVRGDVSRVGDRAAADNADFDF